MINELFKLANKLDKVGQTLVADEVDVIAKKALALTPEKEKELDESVDRYFANPKIQERNRLERGYGLDEDDMLGLEVGPWYGFEHSYEGVPKDLRSLAKPHKRYQTVILGARETIPAVIVADDGSWYLCDDELEAITQDYPPYADEQTGRISSGEAGDQLVYMFKSTKDMEHEQEKAPFKKELEKMLAEPDEVETTEIPEDIVEVKEPKNPLGGGVHIF